MGLYDQLYFDNIGQEEVCLFLRELLRHLRGQVIVVLDNSSTHKGAPLQQLLRQHSRLHIEQFIIIFFFQKRNVRLKEHRVIE